MASRWLIRQSYFKLSSQNLISPKSSFQITKKWSHTATSESSFKYSHLEIIKASPVEMTPKPDPNRLVFGHHFGDHMLEIEWKSSQGWSRPRICPVHNFHLHPSAKVFHYAQELFEGLKAYRGVDNKIRLFRPELNMKRMFNSSERIGLPLFDAKELLSCIKKLVEIDQEWVPYHNVSSLYLRPTFIGVEVLSNMLIVSDASNQLGDKLIIQKYRSTCQVLVKSCHKYVYMELPVNYGPTIAIQKAAEKMNLQQVLWLFGDQLTEISTMNLFVFWKNEKGEKELITPPLNGIILPGVTRQSILDIAREWNEFKVTEGIITMKEVIKALKEERFLEMFGSGTACIICPVGNIHYLGQELKIPTLEHKDPLTMRMLKTVTDIQDYLNNKESIKNHLLLLGCILPLMCTHLWILEEYLTNGVKSLFKSQISRVEIIRNNLYFEEQTHTGLIVPIFSLDENEAS